MKDIVSPKQLIKASDDRALWHRMVVSTRGQRLRLFYSDYRTKMYVLIFFSVRVILLWDCLPTALAQDKNLFVFKTMLRSLDLAYHIMLYYRQVIGCQQVLSSERK